MAILKKNIWLLFYVFLIIGFVSLFSNIYFSSMNTLNKYKFEQENITKMTANSLNSVFSQYEMILNILNLEIVKNNHLMRDKTIIETFDKLTGLNSSILALGVSDTNGNINIVNSKFHTSKMKNLLHDKNTKESFLYTLKSEKMVIGRTYFNETINKFIVPLRKTIRDAKGNILGVLTCSIDLKKGFDFFLNNRELSSDYETFLFRDFDNYFQLAPYKNSMNPEVYNYRIDEQAINKSIALTEKTYNMSIEDIKNEELIITLKTIDGRESLSTSKYIKNFELWLSTQIPMKIIYSKMIKDSIFFVIIFFILFFILFLLFKYINEAEQKKRIALYNQANQDYLTKLFNRQYLSNIFEKQKGFENYSLLFIDIDNFKNINDNYGHMFGDELLKHISQRLKRLTKDTDIIIRYSGDEFLFISEIVNKKRLSQLALDIISDLSSPYYIKQYKFNVTASLGVAKFPNHGNNFDEVKRAADMAMYIAKKKKNSYYFYEDSLKRKYKEKLVLENKLMLSLENNEIYLVYQPQIDKLGNLYGVEALVRWENEELGFIPPDKFIKVAESLGFINKLGKFIIQSALNDIKLIQKATNKSFQLSINISIDQFIDENFYEDFIASTQKEDFDTKLITLELTESIFIKNIDYVLNLLTKLKELGVKVSLDDFGTGYSSLSLLKTLPIDELKIDKSFIDDILISKSSKNVVKSIISIGKEFDMNILCEGVEEKKQVEELTRLNCDLFQGYHFAKPLKKEALIEFINS